MHNPDGGASAEDGAPLRSSGRKKLFYLSLWALYAALLLLPALVRQSSLLAFPSLKTALGPDDPDDWVCLVQTRQWLAGSGTTAGFFDHFLRNTNAPFNGAPYHWTRLMEMLLSLSYFLTPRSLPFGLRLMLGAKWLAPLLCLVAGAFLAGAAWRHFRRSYAVVLPLLLIVLSRCFEANFEPGDADHRGFLCMMWCGVLFLLMDNALLAGGMLGLMTWTCIEGLVPAGLVLGLMGVEARVKPDRAKVLFSVALGAALVATLGVFVEIPAQSILSLPGYGSLSIVHVALFWLATAGTGLLVLKFPRQAAFRARLFIAAAAGGGVLLAQYLLYPKIFQAPWSASIPSSLTTLFRM